MSKELQETQKHFMNYFNEIHNIEKWKQVIEKSKFETSVINMTEE
jgi:hypothetical protein